MSPARRREPNLVTRHSKATKALLERRAAKLGQGRELTIDIPGAAFVYLEGTGAYQQCEQPDEQALNGPAWVELGRALRKAEPRKVGFGYSYRATMSPEAARYLRMYADTNPSIGGGETGTDPEAYSEAAACIRLRDRIDKMLRC